MNVKLKKFSILKPKAIIKAGFMVINRETYSGNAPVNGVLALNLIGRPILGNIVINEED